jgi:hypothetical protein
MGYFSTSISLFCQRLFLPIPVFPERTATDAFGQKAMMQAEFP